jgi:transcription-repair coupling factor (superfamily II helicase)
VLTLSATPIPRTLHLAMVGVRDISSLATPPVDRRAIVTQTRHWNDELVREAVLRELNRDGQVYFVHNFVRDIEQVANRLRALAPDARVVVGHGQMSGPELEDVMLQFMRREADVLVSTNIIESGIDIPSANTIFINRAERFGLADLHQLRGRVGRSGRRAYCYLLLSPKHPPKERAFRSRCATWRSAAPATCSDPSSPATSRRSATKCTASCWSRPFAGCATSRPKSGGP